MAAILQQNSRFDKIERVFEPIVTRLDKIEQTQTLFQQIVEQKFKKQEEANMRNMAEIEARFNGLAGGQSDSSQCGPTKRARAVPCASESRSTISFPSTPASSRLAEDDAGKNNNHKLHISTHGQAHITRDALKPAISAVAEEADLTNCYEIIGPNFGSIWPLLFTGETRVAELRARQFCAALRDGEGGGWREIAAPSPRPEEDDVKIYITPDRTPEQRNKEFQWRMLKQALRKVKDLSWQFENRDKVASVSFFPIVQLGYDYINKECKLAWFDSARSLEIFGEGERKAVAKEYETLLSRGQRRG